MPTWLKNEIVFQFLWGGFFFSWPFEEEAQQSGWHWLVRGGQLQTHIKEFGVDFFFI